VNKQNHFKQHPILIHLDSYQKKSLKNF